MGLLRSCSRLPVIAAIVAAGLVVAACGSGSIGSNTSTGSTAATSGTSSSMPATITYATANTTTLRLPVSGGQIVVATLAGTVDHTGALTLRHSGKRVTLTNFVIKTKVKHLIATVGGRSMPIFDLNLASPTRANGPHGTAVASNIKLTVTSHAATALNSALGVSTFKAGKNFGIATLTVAYAHGHR